MKTIAAFITLSIIASSALAAETTLKLFENEKYRDIKIFEVMGTKISADCFKKGNPECAAWKAYSGKPVKVSESKTDLAGNPAARYCGDLKSNNRILKATDGKEYDYCVFTDGSMVDSWSLYNKHFKKK